jgi:oligoendopeptidase F
MKTTLKRSEIPLEMTWDLSPVYVSPEDWEADFTHIENGLGDFEKYEGKLSDPATLLECLTLRDETGKLIGKLYSYASLTKSQDNANPDSQARYDRIVGLWSRRSAATAFIEPEILAIDSQTLNGLVESEDGLKLYSYYFETLERTRAHTRSGEVEEVLAQLAETRGACEQAFRMFDHADLKFPKIKNDQGEEVELTHGTYINFLQSTNREVREAAFKAMHGTFVSWKNTMAATLSGTVKSHVAMARIRKYDSVLDLELAPDSNLGLYQSDFDRS